MPVRFLSAACLLLCFAATSTAWSQTSGSFPPRGTATPQSQPADTAKIKNVLFIISDDLKASVLGCYGDTVCQTPNIDALAAQGVVFDRSYCQGTWCAPSRQSLMYSRYVGDAGTNLGEHFRHHGWYTARVGKIYHMRVPGDIIAGTDGADVASTWTERFNSQGSEAHTPGDYACLNQNIFTTDLENRQSTRMPHRPYVTVRYEGDGSDQPDHKSATKAIELLGSHQDEPFLLAVGLVRPHYPMVAPHQYFEPYAWQKIKLPETREDDLDDIPKSGLGKSRDATNSMGEYPDNKKRMWQGYYASVAFVDDQVGRILEELDRLNLRDSTAIVFTSDHGYHLGEHTFWQKSNLHEDVTRVPMIISVPGIQPGRTSSLAELVDLYPTLASLAGLPVPELVQGKDLTPVLLNRRTPIRSAALSVDRGGNAIRTDKWSFMQYADGTCELYNMVDDPNQFTNLAELPEHARSLKEWKTRLANRLRAADAAPKTLTKKKTNKTTTKL